MVKEANFNLSDETIKNILNAKNIIEENMKKLNITNELLDFKDTTQVIKLYDDETYIARYEGRVVEENLALENQFVLKLWFVKLKKVFSLNSLKNIFHSFFEI